MPDDELENVEQGEDFLEGLCDFPDEVNAKPSQIRIASPFIGFSNLIKSLVVDTEDGPKEIPYNLASFSKPGSLQVIGFIKDQLTIDFLQKSNNGKGIQVASPKNPKQLMTLDEWKEEYNTDAIALILMMRLWWLTSGGGVTKPYQADVIYKKLGTGGRTTIR